MDSLKMHTSLSKRNTQESEPECSDDIIMYLDAILSKKIILKVVWKIVYREQAKPGKSLPPKSFQYGSKIRGKP